MRRTRKVSCYCKSIVGKDSYFFSCLFLWSSQSHMRHRFVYNGGHPKPDPTPHNSLVTVTYRNESIDLIVHWRLTAPLRNNFATATLFSVNGQCKKKYFGFYSRFRFEYFRYCFIFVFASIFVSIFVFVNDSNVFSLTIIFVFVNEIITVSENLRISKLYAIVFHVCI